MKELSQLIGSKPRLAIEYSIGARVNGMQLGNIRLWAADSAIGDYEQVTDLGTTFFHLRQLSENAVLNDIRFLDRDKDSILTELERRLYGLETGDLQDAVRNELAYRCLIIAPGGGECFDGEFAVLIHQPRTDRVIWRAFDDGAVRELLLPGGYFASLIEQLPKLERQTD